MTEATKLKKLYIEHSIQAFLKDTPKDISIHTGMGSRILTLIEINRYNESLISMSEIRKNIQEYFNLIELGESHSPTFCNGLAGAGWLIHYLNEHNFISIDIDVFLEHIDKYLLEYLKYFLKNGNFDILHGATGVGLYFLKRNNKAVLSEILGALRKHAIVNNGEFMWSLKDIGHSKLENYDMGLAHGQMSVLYFIGKCYINDISKSLCKEMASGIFKFFFNNIQDIKVVGSFWPHSISRLDYANKTHEKSRSRMAWCYGDLGILHTMHVVSMWLKNKSLQFQVEELALQTVNRRAKLETLVDNPYFCHGISGILTIYSNFYFATMNKTFKETARFWEKQLILEEIPVVDVVNPNTLPNLGVLSGLEGITLSLLSTDFRKNINDWKECLFMS